MASGCNLQRVPRPRARGLRWGLLPPPMLSVLLPLPMDSPAALACFNLLGSFLSGWLIDRVSPKKVLTFLPLISALSLAALAIFPASTLVLLCVIGFAYGGTIAAYPAAISQRFQGDDGPRVYGRVFTAWGTAGLLAPWVAGKIFDQTGGYGEALWIASALALVSSLLAVKAIGRG